MKKPSDLVQERVNVSHDRFIEHVTGAPDETSRKVVGLLPYVLHRSHQISFAHSALPCHQARLGLLSLVSPRAFSWAECCTEEAKDARKHVSGAKKHENGMAG